MNIESEEVELEEVENEEIEEEQKEQEVEEEKTQETLEAKRTRLQRQLDQTDKKLGREKPKSKAKQSDEFDYGEYAYLAQKGIESDDDIKFVQDCMADSGKSLRDTLNSGWFKSELSERQQLDSTASAVPKGKAANTAATDDVAYWSAKPIEEVPREMRAKVVSARRAKEQDQGKFYNS